MGQPSILDTALAVRRGQVKLADVPAESRGKVATALRHRAALIQHARDKVYRPREGRFVRDGAYINRP